MTDQPGHERPGDTVPHQDEIEELIEEHVPEGGSQSVETNEPADEDVDNSTANFWWDDSEGIPSLRVKGKDSAGTVFTATIPMTEAP